MTMDRNIGRVARNNNGKLGLITSLKGNEYRGISLDDRGGWSSINPDIVTYEECSSLGIRPVRCNNGRIGFSRSSSSAQQLRGVGLDGKNWTSRNPTFLSWKRVASIVRKGNK